MPVNEKNKYFQYFIILNDMFVVPPYFEFSSCKETYIDIYKVMGYRESSELHNEYKKYKKDKINIFCIEFDISDWEEEIEDDWSHSVICHPTLYQQTSASANNIYSYSLMM